MTAFQRRVAAIGVPAARPAQRLPQSDRRPTADLALTWREDDGTVRRDTRALPDVPLLAAAFSGFARGTLLPGPDGDIAIEDLVPGDRLRVRGGGCARISWIGARTHVATARPILYRVAAGAFGASGPAQDVILGALAHVLVETPRCRDLVGGPVAFAPLVAFEDGHAVTALLPPGAVTVYGIACDAQDAVPVAGLPVEIWHPARAMGQDSGPTIPGGWARLLLAGRGGANLAPPCIPRLTFAQAQDLAIAGI